MVRNHQIWWLGMAMLFIAVIVWVTIDTVHDGPIPTLPHLGEFLSSGTLAIYGIDRATRKK